MTGIDVTSRQFGLPAYGGRLFASDFWVLDMQTVRDRQYDSRFGVMSERSLLSALRSSAMNLYGW